MNSQYTAIDNPGCAMIGSNIPKKYQLVKKADGELILQGYFTWTCTGCERCGPFGATGGDWRDIPTIIVPAPPEKITLMKKLRKHVVDFFSS